MKILSFHSLKKWLFAHNDFTYFRGQRESKWLLDSSLTRLINSTLLKNHPVPQRPYAAFERYVLQTFRSSAHLFDDSFLQYATSDLTLLAYAQHFGCPTRLLDITLSKYMALFFAFADLETNNRSAFVRVFQFDVNEMGLTTLKLISEKNGDTAKFRRCTNSELFDFYIKPNKFPCLFTLQPPLLNNRLHIQKGAFLCSGMIDKSIDSLFKEYYTSGINYVDISKKLARQTMVLLNQMGISFQSLYGGVESFAKDVKNDLLYI